MEKKYVYEVDYPDGTTKQLTANIIDENMPSQVDSEGHHYPFLTGVTDHKRYCSVITKVNSFIKSSNENLHRNSTTCGWKILVEWKYGSVDWVPLKDLKQSNPVELSEYSVANEISDEPDFSWWVKETFCCQGTIISKVKSKYFRTSYKFGIRVPKTLK